MTFEEWLKYAKHMDLIKSDTSQNECAFRAWQFQQTRIDALEAKLAALATKLDTSADGTVCSHEEAWAEKPEKEKTFKERILEYKDSKWIKLEAKLKTLYDVVIVLLARLEVLENEKPDLAAKIADLDKKLMKLDLKYIFIFFLIRMLRHQLDFNKILLTRHVYFIHITIV